MKPLSARGKQSALLRVNWAHPLARGLRDCIVFSVGGQWGLVNLGDPRGKPRQGTQSPGHSRTSVGGPGRFTPENDTGANSGTGYDWYIPNYINYSATDFSGFCRFVPGTNATNNVYAGLFCKTDSTSGELGILFDMATTSIGSTYGNINYRIFGGLNGGSGIFISFVKPNIVNDFAMTIHKSATGPIKYYANGVLGGSEAVDTTASATDNVSLTLGRGPLGNQSAPIDFQCFYTWSRQLSDAEYYQLHLDPYCFLENYDVGLRRVATAAVAEAPLKRRVRNLYFR